MNVAVETPHQPLRDAMVEDHDRIEELLDRLVRSEGEETRQTERWLECAALIAEHLEIEDKLLLPAFELTEPVIGRVLRADHTRIRLLCKEIGVAFGLRAERDAGIKALSRLIHAHHRREATAMHEWGVRAAW